MGVGEGRGRGRMMKELPQDCGIEKKCDARARFQTIIINPIFCGWVHLFIYTSAPVQSPCVGGVGNDNYLVQLIFVSWIWRC